MSDYSFLKERIRINIPDISIQRIDIDLPIIDKNLLDYLPKDLKSKYKRILITNIEISEIMFTNGSINNSYNIKCNPLYDKNIDYVIVDQIENPDSLLNTIAGFVKNNKLTILTYGNIKRVLIYVTFEMYPWI